MEIREANEADLPAVHALICELAEYEKAPEAVTLTRKQLAEDFSDSKPRFFIIVAENNNRIVGMALYFYTYSTWKGRCLYLEDMIVTKSYRNQGIGQMLFERLIQIASSAQARRMAWQVLDWNERAIQFYHKYGAYLDPEWVNGKLTGNQIQQWANAFAKKSEP